MQKEHELNPYLSTRFSSRLANRESPQALVHNISYGKEKEATRSCARPAGF